MSKEMLCIPISHNKSDVNVYLDELQDIDYNDIIDVLIAELAPLEIWKKCALEYYRQGFHDECECILRELVDSLVNPKVQEVYSQPSDNERKAEIYDALASIFLQLFAVSKHGSKESTDETARKVVEYLRKSEELMPLNEYTWLIKGFYELSLGELKRAEDNFRAVHDRSAKVGKKKYLFGASVGLAACSFYNGNHAACLDFLSKAVITNPDCSASVRLGIAIASFKSGQFNRSRFAALRTLELEPDNVDALLLLCLLELTPGRKEKSNNGDTAFEYCILASTLNPSHALALNHMANFLFSRSSMLEGRIGDIQSTILVCCAAENDIMAEDFLEIGSFTTTVTSVNYSTTNGNIIAEVSTRDEFLTKAISFQVKITPLSKIWKLVHKSSLLPSSKNVRSECLFMFGKFHHIQGNIDTAFDCYRSSIKEDPDMILAQFEAAKILFSRKDFSSALELFNIIAKKFPDDKDTQGFILLISSILHKEIFPLEKLRDYSKFQFDADLWLVQAFNRHHDLNEHGAAIKCYIQAIDVLQSTGSHVPSSILYNLSVLYHSLGKHSQAMDYIIQGFKSEQNTIGIEPGVTASYKILQADEFDDVLYEWKEANILISKFEASGFTLTLFVDDVSDESPFLVDDEVIVNGIKVSVMSVSRDRVVLHGPLVHLIEDQDNISLMFKTFIVTSISVHPTVWYNYGRILEVTGHIVAAIELYECLISLNPGFLDCYGRLGFVYNSLNKYDDALSWIEKGLRIDPNNENLINMEGDLYYQTKKYEGAKKNFEKLISKNKRDARATVSLGCLYFSSHGTKYEALAKDSNKFFHAALSEDPKNVSAAIGIGMVCAQKGKLGAAADIFSRAREMESVISSDALTNLAYVRFSEKRNRDADNLLTAAFKLKLKYGSSYECSLPAQECLVQNSIHSERLDDSEKYQLRCIHQCPSQLKLWYNFACIYCTKSVMFFKKNATNKLEVAEMIENMSLASYVFSYIINAKVKIVPEELIRANDSVCREYLHRIIDISTRLEKKSNLVIEPESLDSTPNSMKRKFETFAESEQLGME